MPRKSRGRKTASRSRSRGGSRSRSRSRRRGAGEKISRKLKKRATPKSQTDSNLKNKTLKELQMIARSHGIPFGGLTYTQLIEKIGHYQ